MIDGMSLVLNAFKNDVPFSVEVQKNDGELIFVGNFYDLYILNYNGYKVSDEVSLDTENRILKITIEPYDWLEDEIKSLRESIKNFWV